MCGIAGMIGAQCDRQTRDRMLQSMAHRGPDGEGEYTYADCTLLHRRLAVIDPAGGKQPMMLEFEGERYVIVYNGELYNTAQLRQRLKILGHNFLTASDTEVVLHAYVQWKECCLQEMNGIFAFAVWHEKGRKLFMARDRIGVKPLFYRHRDGVLIFASEIKTILACPNVERVLNEQGAAEILMLGPGRTPGCGVFRDICELEPGCFGFFEQGKLRLRRYWRLTDRHHSDSFEQTVEKVRYLVTDSINRQMVSDVPLGAFLSGGLDSSLICAVCAKQMTQRGEQLRTFSVDYEDSNRYFTPGKFQPESDNAYIHLIHDSISDQHRWSVLTSEQLDQALEEATVARDLPGMADVDSSLLEFCKDIRSDVTVALSGECADEIFGGYPWYRDPKVRAVDGFPWSQNLAQREELLHPQLGSRIDAEDYVRERYRTTCQESDILPENPPLERRMKEMMNLNFRWFMQTLLDRKDRMSMHSSLEVRVPFCDYRIAEYLYAVPWGWKDHNGIEKGLLRTAMQGIVPDAVLWRKKSPYPKTYHPKYRELISERFRELLHDPHAPLWYLADQSAAEKLLSQVFPWPWYGQLMTETQTMAYLLQVDFWLRHYEIQFAFS